MMDKVKAFFESELKSVARADAHGYEWVDRETVVSSALSRCLGVTFFVQSLGVDYAEVAPLYDEYKAKIEQYRYS